MKNLLVFGLLLLLFACQSNSSQNQTNGTTHTPHQKQADSAKAWLVNTIDEYFKEHENIHLPEITTEEYCEFKTDATNVDLDSENSLTESQFEQKWKDKFDLEYRPTQSGFLISEQDWSDIEVTTCELIASDEDKLTFKTVITDKGFNTSYNRDITVVKRNDKFLIADVAEYD